MLVIKAFLFALAVSTLQVSCAEISSKINLKVNKTKGHNGSKGMDKTPFDIPTQMEIEKLIREDGFMMAVAMRVVDLLSGMLSAPFRWVYRVGEFLIIVLKLASEAVRQFNERHRTTRIHFKNVTYPLN